MLLIFSCIEIILLIGTFLLWAFDPLYFHVGYVVFHTYPVFYAIVAFLFRKTCAKSLFWKKIIALLFPIVLWMFGLLIVYQKVVMY